MNRSVMYLRPGRSVMDVRHPGGASRPPPSPAGRRAPESHAPPAAGPAVAATAPDYQPPGGDLVVSEVPPGNPLRPLTAVPGIGPASARKLTEERVTDIASLLRVDPRTLGSILGTTVARAAEILLAASKVLEGDKAP